MVTNNTTNAPTDRVYIAADYCRWISSDNKQQAESHFIVFYKNTAAPLSRSLHTQAFKFGINNRDEFVSEVIQNIFLKLQDRVSRREGCYSKSTDALNSCYFDISENWSDFAKSWVGDAWTFCANLCPSNNEWCDSQALDLNDKYQEIKAYMKDFGNGSLDKHSSREVLDFVNALSILRVPTFPLFLFMAKNESIAFTKKQNIDVKRFETPRINQDSEADDDSDSLQTSSIEEIPDIEQKSPDDIDPERASLYEQIQRLLDKSLVPLREALKNSSTSQEQKRSQNKLAKAIEQHEVYWQIIEFQTEEKYTIEQLSELLNLTFDQTRARLNKLQTLLAPIISRKIEGEAML